MKKFYTGLRVSHTKNMPHPPFIGKGWRSNYENYTRSRADDNCKEVVIRASTQSTAQKALMLIIGSLNLYEGEVFLHLNDLVAFNRDEPKELRQDERYRIENHSFSTINIPTACFIAAKASYRKKFIYSITKYNFSTFLYSAFSVDLEPFRSPHLPISPYPEVHVRFAHSIISAYSALEELGIELRASKTKPSMIKGNWNPLVKKDLEDRLLKSNININERFIWAIRGTRSRIEKKKSPQIIKKAPWAYGVVRDGEIELIDAIAYSSWLRSYVSSHKIKEISESISPYDVINCQSLSRWLILDSLKITF